MNASSFAFLAAGLVFQASAVSQHITVTVSHLSTGQATLSALSGEKATTVDSVNSSGEGTFTFQLSSPHHRGMYRLAFDRSPWIDFINDGEEVEIVSDSRYPLDSLKVLRSESNRLYYLFRRMNQQYRTKSEILQLVLARYPHDDPYYHTTQTATVELQQSYSDLIGSATRANPASFIARYVRSARLPVLDLTQPLDQQLAYLKTHALDQIDFTDEGLIHSDVFTSKSIEYLMYFRNPQLPRELLAKEFNGAVDSILNKAKVNQAVYRHITEYLIEGFKQFGFEDCINYILQNYVIKDDLCLEGSGNTIQRMIDQKKRLSPGTIAPEVVLPDTAGRPISLRNMAGERTLVVFYSTACPHCQSMIPRLSEIARQGVLAVLAVSLDERRGDWLDFIKANRLTWVNVIDTGGWSGRAASDYCIYATPTMLLLDGEKKIIGKPLTIEELQKLL